MKIALLEELDFDFLVYLTQRSIIGAGREVLKAIKMFDQLETKEIQGFKNKIRKHKS